MSSILVQSKNPSGDSLPYFSWDDCVVIAIRQAVYLTFIRPNLLISEDLNRREFGLNHYNHFLDFRLMINIKLTLLTRTA